MGRLRTPIVALALATPLALAAALNPTGWRDLHANYPGVPQSYTQLVDRFGNPCSAAASAIALRWRAADDGVTYTVRFHRRLGGMATAIVADQGGRSTNLDNDVYGHIAFSSLASAARHGIYGYACRAKRSDPTQWSVHAFGAAVDISSAIEPMGQCTSVVNYRIAPTFQGHGWTWGLSFCDPMHFQYVVNY
ncbi:MAG: M15 family metallopeptidase [Actinomycetota bacterium]